MTEPANDKMDGAVDPNAPVNGQRDLSETEKRFLMGCLLAVVAGGIGGYILQGGPLAGCGGMMGALLALPLGGVFAGICMRYRLSVWIVCASQLAGALALGLPQHRYVPFLGDLGWPLLGQFVGGACGALIAFGFRRPTIRAGHCRHCGYNLTGNVSGRCPECGATCLRPAGRS